MNQPDHRATGSRAAKWEHPDGEVYHRGYQAGILEGERKAAEMVALIVDAAGGEVTVTPTISRRKLRLERHDHVITDQVTFKAVEDA